MAKPSYDETIQKLSSGMFKVVHLRKDNKEVTTYVTMNEEIARNNGFINFKITEQRKAEDKALGMATVCNLQSNKYMRIDLNEGRVKLISRLKGTRVPSNVEGYNLVKISYEELLSMLIKGKLTVKFIKRDNTERVMVATRNPQIIKAMSPVEITFNSLAIDKRAGILSVFDCEKKEKRVINYKTLVELLGYEGPESSQVRVIRVIYIDGLIEGLIFNVMGKELSLKLDDAFTLIDTGICINARTDRNKIHYSSAVDRIEYLPQAYTSVQEVQQIIRDRAYYITTGEAKGMTVVAERKTTDLTKLIELLNAEYGFSVPKDVTEIQIEFK